MMKRSIVYIIGTLLSCNFLKSQSTPASSNTNNSLSQNAADFLATNGKYHVVIGVLVVIFLGLVVYGWMLHRKISKLEANQR